MSEFNIKFTSMDDRSLLHAKDKLMMFSGKSLIAVAGSCDIYRSLREVLKDLSSPESEFLVGADDKRSDKCKSLPLDLACLFDDKSYLVLKGRSLFGAVNEPEGYFLTERIYNSIVRNFFN